MSLALKYELSLKRAIIASAFALSMFSELFRWEEKYSRNNVITILKVNFHRFLAGDSLFFSSWKAEAKLFLFARELEKEYY